MPVEEALETRPFVCPHCDRASNGVVRGRAFWDTDSGSQGPPVEWALVQCDRCFEPTLQVREDFGGGFADDNPVIVYPVPPRLSPSVPAGLRREWDEAQTCFRAKAYAACVVMVRRTLEGTCADQGVKARSLAQGLQQLAANGLMDERLLAGQMRFESLATRGLTSRASQWRARTPRTRLRSPRRCSITFMSCASGSRSFLHGWRSSCSGTKIVSWRS